MGKYVLRRLLLIIPTLFGVILINFTIVQFAPGGPIEQIIAKATMGQMSTTSAISGGGDTGMSSQAMEQNAATQNPATYGLDPELLDDLVLHPQVAAQGDRLVEMPRPAIAQNECSVVSIRRHSGRSIRRRK